jgi:hypothetical protein
LHGDHRGRGEIVCKTDRPDGSADLDYLVPDHRAIAIFRNTWPRGAMS